MQILMSDSLLNRVSNEEPSSEKLMANFVLVDVDKSVPVTRLEWEDGCIVRLGLAIPDLKILPILFQSEDVVDVGIPSLEVYCQNIFGGSYKLLEHNNYSYELLLELENDDG